MSRKANPTLIGVFVLVAIALALGALVALAGGGIFEKRTEFVMYFDQDIFGLDVGAPVTFRGVKVGEIKSIQLIYDHADGSLSMPVVAEMNETAFVQKNQHLADDGHDFQRQIDRGLRARVDPLSMVTGKLKVSLDYHRNSPINYRSPHDSEHPEIPTIPGVIESLGKKLNDLPLEDMILDLRKSTQALATLLESGILDSTMNELNQTLATARGTLEAPETMKTLEGVSVTVEEARLLLAAFRGETLPNLNKLMEHGSELVGSGDIRDMMTAIEDSLNETQVLLKGLGRNSEPMRDQILQLLDQLTRSARSAEIFLDYLERHPDALLKGKASP